MLAKGSTAGRVLFAFALVAFVSGCSAYHSVPVTSTGGIADGAIGWDQIEKGSYVKLVLTSGEVVTGQVASVKVDRIAIEKASNYGYNESVHMIDDIVTLEVEKPTRAGKAVAVVLIGSVTLVVVGLGFLLWVFHDADLS